MNALVYDLEIKRAIPPRDGSMELGVEYCEGWEDYAGMGIACVGVWDCLENVPLIFCEDNLSDFQRLVNQRQLCVGFNSIKFDNHVLDAHGIEIPRHQSYDLLRELWISDGLNPDQFNFKTHGGYSLEKCCNVNFGTGKSGDGALAPLNWQQGKIGNVVSYCLRDVMLTRRLFLRAATQGGIKHPKTGEIVNLKVPVV